MYTPSNKPMNPPTSGSAARPLGAPSRASARPWAARPLRGRKGSTMRKSVLVFVFLLLMSGMAYGLDNPDAPNYVAEFQARMAPYHAYLDHKAKTTSDYIRGYARLNKALDGELNSAYRKLLPHLKPPQQEQLRASQRAWLKFRDAELKFIDNNWTQANFGSSYGISQGVYKATIVKNRVTELLWYLKNY